MVNHVNCTPLVHLLCDSFAESRSVPSSLLVWSSLDSPWSCTKLSYSEPALAICYMSQIAQPFHSFVIHEEDYIWPGSLWFILLTPPTSKLLTASFRAVSFCKGAELDWSELAQSPILWAQLPKSIAFLFCDLIFFKCHFYKLISF